MDKNSILQIPWQYFNCFFGTFAFSILSSQLLLLNCTRHNCQTLNYAATSIVYLVYDRHDK